MDDPIKTYYSWTCIHCGPCGVFYAEREEAVKAHAEHEAYEARHQVKPDIKDVKPHAGAKPGTLHIW